MTTRPDRAQPRRVRRSAVASAALVLAAVALAGCAAGSSSSSAESVAPAPASLQQPGAVDSGKADTGAATSGGVTSPLAATADRSIVVRADLTVRVADLTKATARLGEVAARRRATIASQSTSVGDGGTPAAYATGSDGSQACPASGCPTPYASSTTVLRIANADVDALIADVSGLGTVEASTRTSDDVTAEVADVAARVSNAEASLARVRALMSRATSVGDVVALEGELSKREADLEALQARQRAYADQTAQATVTVRLLDSGAPVTTEATTTGFLPGLRSGWDGLTSALTIVLTAVGVLVPWLIVLVPLALLVGYVLRRRRPLGSAPVAAGIDHATD